MRKIKKRKFIEKLQRFLRLIYIKLVRINDSPLKIALGFGLGVFVGVMPAIGPIAAILLAFIFRVNRASALLGCILFNTWFGVIIFLLAVKTGSSLMGLSYNSVYEGWNLLIKNFHFSSLLKLSVYKILIPITIGYFVISLCLGILAFVVAFVVARQIKNRKLETNTPVSR